MTDTDDNEKLALALGFTRSCHDACWAHPEGPAKGHYPVDPPDFSDDSIAVQFLVPFLPPHIVRKTKRGFCAHLDPFPSNEGVQVPKSSVRWKGDVWWVESFGDALKGLALAVLDAREAT